MAVGAYSMGARLHLRVSDVQKSEQDFITLLEVVGREVKVLILFLIKEEKYFHGLPTHYSSNYQGNHTHPMNSIIGLQRILRSHHRHHCLINS